jgi:hypothetical protein
VKSLRSLLLLPLVVLAGVVALGCKGGDDPAQQTDSQFFKDMAAAQAKTKGAGNGGGKTMMKVGGKSGGPPPPVSATPRGATTPAAPAGTPSGQ